MNIFMISLGLDLWDVDIGGTAEFHSAAHLIWVLKQQLFLN